MTESVTAAVGMGGNVGDRLAALRTAVETLDAAPEITVVAVSPVYETEALVRPGAAPQPDHLNAVVVLETSLAPFAVLRTLHAVERAAGRDPDAERWSPRPLDLDLLLYGDAEIATAGLTVPHPALARRRFVLTPLADVVPEVDVPGLGTTVGDLLAACPDPLAVVRTDLALR